MGSGQSGGGWESKRKGEPVLAIDQIQGNIIPGFNKDYQAFLFLKIDDVEAFRRWLKALIPSITTMEQVLGFRSLLTIEERHGKPPQKKETWVNIAFSYTALRRLGVCKGGYLKENAFKEGLWRRSEALNDPISPAKGNPREWLVGGPDNEADVVLIIGGDDFHDQLNVANFVATPIVTEERTKRSGFQIIYRQHGANLLGPLAVVSVKW